MCYHTALTVRPGELGRRFRRRETLVVGFRPRYRVSAFQHAEYPVVTADEELQLFRWGLIPFWTGTAEDALHIRNRTLNARAETLFTKPCFREPIRRRRCLVPVSGFFEWSHAAGRSTPFYITVKGVPVVALAGIYDCWRNPELDETVGTYSIITVASDPPSRRLNPRMPALLQPDDEERWLDPTLDDRQIADLLRPFPAGWLDAYPVRRDFLRLPSDDKRILAPFEAERLFA